MPLKRKTIIPSLVLLAVMVALLFCSKDYNPFADLTNAKVHVVSWSFANRDSVPLYSTGTLKLVVALHEDVDSFVLKVPGNRYWTDTAIRSGPSVADGGPFTFSISFYDTGLQSVTIETHRSNGEVVPQVFTVFVTNVLRQAGINGVFGKPFTLSTPAVADKDVFYHWDFGPGRRDSSRKFAVKIVLLFCAQQGKGDALGDRSLRKKFHSPRLVHLFVYRHATADHNVCRYHRAPWRHAQDRQFDAGFQSSDHRFRDRADRFQLHKRGAL